MQKTPFLLSLCLLLSITMLPVHASTANSSLLKLKMMVFEEVEHTDHNGKKTIQLVEPANIIPNDTVVYVTEYQNTGTETATNVVITNPIPNHLIYIQGSATQDDVLVTFSINNGKSFHNANHLMITNNEGKKQPASPKDYTHIRWTIPSIKANNKGLVRFSTRLK